MALVAWAWCALLTGLGIGAALCWHYQAVPGGTTLPWQLLTGPVAVAAAIAFAACIAVQSPGILTIPLVMLGLFVSHSVLYQLHLPQLFSPDFATGPMTPLRPTASYLLLDLASNTVMFIGSMAWLVWKVRVAAERRTMPLVVTCLCALVLVALSIYRITALADTGLYS